MFPKISKQPETKKRHRLHRMYLQAASSQKAEPEERPEPRWWGGRMGRDVGVSKNRGTPKWMVKIMENPIQMDDLGGNPLFLETPM